jgi:glyoxylase-like metal-dependent hydrolase (beta-lactamase superfamily II)
MLLLKIFASVFCIVGLSLNQLTGNEKGLVITPLTENMYVFTTYKDYKGTPYPSNGVYVVTEQGVLMIDTPWDTAQFQPLLDSIKARHNKEVRMVISTHFHDDRTAGLNYYRSKGMQTYTTVKTDSLSKEEGAPRAQFLIKGDTLMKLGNLDFEIYYPGEGHAPDNIVVWFPSQKVLYGGCFIKSTETNSIGNLSHANVRQWPESLKKTRNRFRDPRFIIPGHEGWKNANALDHTLQILQNYKPVKS